ncbi:MAG: hypothetical protein IPM98_17505 [Lewinellaceae bacterium]|nr:hypothetical protein [Lewinellaceae bacterium]
MAILSLVSRLPAHWFYRALATARLAVLFVRAGQYFRKSGLRDLGLAPQHHGRLDLNRHRHYFFGAVFLGAVFGRIRGRALDGAEIRRFSILSALACFFDDLTDEAPGHFLPKADVAEYGRRADPSGLALVFLKKTREALPVARVAEFEEALHRVFQIEAVGAQKALRPPAPDEVERLTAEKGGYSVLLFRCLLADPIPEAERRALLEFGHFVQLCDDIFDLWHDRQRNTTTAATQNDVEQLIALFHHRTVAVANAFRQLHVPGSRPETALHTVFFLVAITRVCLHRYRRLQKKHGTLPLDNRRAMVVDMAQWHTRLQAIWNVFTVMPPKPSNPKPSNQKPSNQKPSNQKPSNQKPRNQKPHNQKPAQT